MSTKRLRRDRGTGKATVPLNAHVDPITKTKIDRVADALGRSQGQVVDLIVSHKEIEEAVELHRMTTAIRAVANVDTYTPRPRQRRKRGDGKLAVALNAHVDPAAKDMIDLVADMLGLSQGQVLDLMLSRTEVDAQGRPDFWNGPLPTDYQRELPMATSA